PARSRRSAGRRPALHTRGANGTRSWGAEAVRRPEAGAPYARRQWNTLLGSGGYRARDGRGEPAWGGGRRGPPPPFAQDGHERLLEVRAAERVTKLERALRHDALPGGDDACRLAHRQLEGEGRHRQPRGPAERTAQGLRQLRVGRRPRGH